MLFCLCDFYVDLTKMAGLSGKIIKNTLKNVELKKFKQLHKESLIAEIYNF